MTYLVSRGYGKHVYEIDHETITYSLLIDRIGVLFFITAAIWSKTSFGLTLVRITTGKLRSTIWILMALMHLAAIITTAMFWLNCQPVQKFWDKNIPGKCWPDDVIIGLAIAGSGIYNSPKLAT
jgi:hypothetical protein